MLGLLLALASAPPLDTPVVESCPTAVDRALQTPDGAWIHLHRHPVAGPPVLVVHGLSSNHDCWDLSPDRSLAVALNQAGFDAWLLDLRGHGDAWGPGLRTRPSWTVDDYGVIDVHTAIEHIKAETGWPQVGYVGHSMGGMVAAIYQAVHGDDALAAVVVVGSPIDFGDLEPFLRLGERGFVAGSALPSFSSPAGARGLSAMGARAPMHADEILFSAPNLSRSGQRAMYDRAISPVFRHELRQFARILDERRFVSSDGSLDYGAALAGLDAPLLVIAGRADLIAPADRVRAYYDAAGSREKAFLVAGRSAGFQADYGHMDMALGDRAAQEIFPRITGWLSGRFPVGPGGD